MAVKSTPKKPERPPKTDRVARGFSSKTEDPYKDINYVSLGKIMKSVRIDPDKMKVEIRRIHKDRSSRKLTSINVTGDELSTTGRRDNSRRSRLVEIASDCREARNEVAKAYDAVHMHIAVTYGKTYFTEFKAIASLNSAVYNMENFVKAADLLGTLDSVIQMATYAIEDIDKSGMNLTMALKALELKARGKDF
ncbi:hypothetical protein SKa4_00237 [Pseudomonas phage vB_PpuM-SKa-4]